MGYFSRDKLGPKAFYLNLKPVTVYLGPYMSHMVYYTPWGIIYQFGGVGVKMWSNNHPVHHYQDL